MTLLPRVVRELSELASVDGISQHRNRLVWFLRNKGRNFSHLIFPFSLTYIGGGDGILKYISMHYISTSSFNFLLLWRSILAFQFIKLPVHIGIFHGPFTYPLPRQLNRVYLVIVIGISHSSGR